MTAESKDFWDKIEVLGGILAGVLVPVAIFLAGFFISSAEKDNAQKLADSNKKSAELSAQVENLTNLIEHLSSENAIQRKIAVEVAAYMASKEQLPVELTPTLLRIAREDKDSETAQTATQAVVSVAQASPEAKAIVTAGFSGVPPRVYFHVPKREMKDGAKSLGESLEKSLENLKLVVPGVQVVAGPSNNELRYFHASEKGEAIILQEALSNLGLKTELADLSKKYENSTGIRPRHYELWYGAHSQ